MKKLSVFLFAALAAGVALVGLAGERTIDWVALNGGSPEKIFGSSSKYETFEDGVAHYADGRLVSELSVESGRFKLEILTPFNAGNNDWCFAFTNETGLTFGEAQKIVVPYKYDMAGTAAVGMRFRLIVGTTTGKKYFGLLSEETIVKGEEAFLTFNLSDVYLAYPTAYAAVKDSPITIMRLYPFEGGSGFTTSATVVSGSGTKFAKNDLLYIGAFAVTWKDITGYTVSFDANGGDPVEDISTDTTGTFTFPPATREGWTFQGWYRDGFRYAAGDAGKVVMDDTYVAGWRHTDLTQGLIQMPTAYRKEIDIYKAFGSLCDVMVGVTVSSYPDIGVCKAIRSDVYEVDAEPIVTGSATNVLFAGKGGNAGNNGPHLILPPVGVTVKDAYDFKIKYRTTSAVLENERMDVYYRVGKTWRHITSSDAMKVSVGDEFNTVVFHLAEALGETTYESIKDSPIEEWHLYPYKLNRYNTKDGERGNIPFSRGVSVELGRIQLIGEHPNGLMLIIK